MIESCGTNCPSSAAPSVVMVRAPEETASTMSREPPSWPPGKALDLDAAAGLLLHLLGDALDHLRGRMARRLVLGPAQHRRGLRGAGDRRHQDGGRDSQHRLRRNTRTIISNPP